jgi:hypothetical protein
MPLHPLSRRGRAGPGRHLRNTRLSLDTSFVLSLEVVHERVGTRLLSSRLYGFD